MKINILSCMLVLTLTLMALKLLGQAPAISTSKDNSSKNNYRNIISYHPLAVFGSGFEMGFESYNADHSRSVFILGGAYLGQGDVFNTNSYNEDIQAFSGLRTLLNYRFYIDIEDTDREYFFFGPYFMFKYISLDIRNMEFNTNSTYSAHAYGPGILIGAMLDVTKRFNFSGLLGSGLVFGSEDKNTSKAHLQVVNPYKKVVGLQLSIGAGYRF